MNFLKNNWIWILLAIVAVWFLTKKKQAAPTGSLAAAVSGVASGVETTISDLSRSWAAIRGDLGFNA